MFPLHGITTERVRSWSFDPFAKQQWRTVALAFMVTTVVLCAVVIWLAGKVAG